MIKRSRLIELIFSIFQAWAGVNEPPSKVDSISFKRLNRPKFNQNQDTTNHDWDPDLKHLKTINQVSYLDQPCTFFLEHISGKR